MGIAFMAILWHGINFILVLFTTFGRNVIHESQVRLFEIHMAIVNIYYININTAKVCILLVSRTDSK